MSGKVAYPHLQAAGATNVLDAFRDDFNSGASVEADLWSVIQTGTGMTVSVSGGKLTIAAGTTANQETIIRSTKAFNLPVILIAILSLSQRIVNQEFYIELATTDGNNKAGWYYDGTTVTNGKYFNINQGTQSTSSAVTIITTASDALAEIEAFKDEVWFHSRGFNAVRTSSNSLQQNVPDPSQLYFVQIRAKNLGTSPASNTNFIIDAITTLNIEEMSADLLGGRGGTNSSQAMPVYITAASGALATNGYNGLQRYAETSTALGSGATFTSAGSGHDTQISSAYGYSRIRALAAADQSGTLYLEQSPDGSTWYTTKTQAVTASTPVVIEDMLVMRYWRVKYINGGTAQGSFRLDSAMVAI